MQHLSTYRSVRVESSCRKFPRPLAWEQHTKLSDDELMQHASRVVDKVCADEPGPSCERHDIVILAIPQTSTGSRRD